MAHLGNLGPYSINQLRTIADKFSLAHNNGTKVFSAAAGGTAKAAERLGYGLPTILLWRETPDFGHFILLHVRRVGGEPDVELFDPLGTTDEGRSWDHYMDDPLGLNDGGLRPYLQDINERGVKLSYTGPREGPQEDSTFSCGLWCILRAAAPDLSPAAFARDARD